MTTHYHPRPERWPQHWFRFSLRTLFVMVTLFCVWLGVQVKWIRDRREAAKDRPGSYVDCISVGPAAATPPWSLRLLGAPGYGWVYVHVADETHLSEDDKRREQRARSLFPEAEIVVVHTEVLSL